MFRSLQKTQILVILLLDDVAERLLELRRVLVIRCRLVIVRAAIIEDKLSVVDELFHAFVLVILKLELHGSQILY